MVKRDTIKNKTVAAEHQRGVVLIVSLVFLVALTAVAAALMQNTTTDIKMSGASQEKALAVQETISEMDRVVYNQVNRVNDGAGNTVNRLAQTVSNPINLTVTKSAITSGTLSSYNAQKSETSCPRAAKAGEGMCNVLRITINRQYGRNNNSNVQVNSGIAQQLFSNE